MFLLKLVLTPTLIGAVSLVERRFGPEASGMLVGLPLTAAPVIAFVAAEHGSEFAARAAEGTLLALVSKVAFCVVYARVARAHAVASGLAAGTSAFLALTAVLAEVSLPVSFVFTLAVGAIILGLALLPAPRAVVTSIPPRRWELPFRMLAATALVVVLTWLAPRLGPRLSGLLAPLPVFAGTLAAFVHRSQGAEAATRFLRGVVAGCFTYALFFLVLSHALVAHGIAAAFLTAVVASVALNAPRVLDRGTAAA